MKNKQLSIKDALIEMTEIVNELKSNETKKFNSSPIIVKSKKKDIYAYQFSDVGVTVFEREVKNEKNK